VTGGWRLVRAGSDAVPESVRRFALRARQRRLRAVTPWLTVATVLVVVALVAGVVWFTGALGVARITVTGTGVLTADEVRAAAAVRHGTPMARVDTRAVAARVGRLAPVYTAMVTRSWPRTLVVRVVERTPVAAVPSGGAFVLVDGTGVAYQHVPQRPERLPVVRLAAPAPSDPTTRAALTVLRSLPVELSGPMAALAADAPARIRLELTDGRTVVWGDATENDAKARVAIVLLGRPGKVLDVSAPTLVTVR
jgi:cell division protein FtsQ